MWIKLLRDVVICENPRFVWPAGRVFVVKNQEYLEQWLSSGAAERVTIDRKALSEGLHVRTHSKAVLQAIARELGFTAGSDDGQGNVATLLDEFAAAIVGGRVPMSLFWHRLSAYLIEETESVEEAAP